MKEKSVQRSALINVCKTIISLAFPLVSFSYAARILLVEGMGKYSFSGSFVNYFVLLAGLGIGDYAIREGARLRTDRAMINRFASEVFSINLYSTAASYILLLGCVFFVEKLKEYRGLILLFSLEIVLTTASVHWVYIIFEEFSFITVVTIVMQFASIAILLLFVREPSDLYAYIISSIVAYTGCGLIQFWYAKRYVHICFIPKPSVSHLRPIVLLFSTALTTVIYVNSDITLLGWMKGDYTTGLYSTAANV